MFLHYPKSFRRLLVLGIALVALPFVGALVTNAFSVDRLVRQSVSAVRTAVQLTHSSRTLGEMITAMERNARQMIVLEDPALAEGYLRMHRELRQTVRQLAALPLNDRQRQHLVAIAAKEQDIATLIGRRDASPGYIADALTVEFAALAALSDAMTASSSQRIESEIVALQQQAEGTQRVMLWQLLGMVPVALLMVLGFITIIVRPVKQIAQAVRRLGTGEFGTAILVKGPGDLEYLGQQLDWLRQRLLELEEQKNRFLRHVSHELKTPLAAVWDGVEMLADEIPGKLNARQREIVLILQNSSRQLRKLIEDLLNFSALQAAPGTIEARPVRLREVVRSAVADNQLGIAAKGLALQFEAANLTVPGDAAKLRVVADNLLSNAIKFAPAASTIRIVLRQHADAALLEVIDAGPGIPEADRERVFDAFYQCPGSSSGAIKGSGLGLSIVREHVEAHRGRVEVVACAPHGGHLRVSLPLRRDGGPP